MIFTSSFVSRSRTWLAACGLVVAGALVAEVAVAQEHAEPTNAPAAGHAPTRPAAARRGAPPAHDPAAEGHEAAPTGAPDSDPEGTGHGDTGHGSAGHGDTGHGEPGHGAAAGHGPTAGHGDTGHGDSAHGEDAAHGEHAAHGGHHGPEPINWTDLSDKKRPAFIALLVNFGLLAALYYTLGKKPVTEGLKQRRVNIGKDIEEARKMLEEAKERSKKYQADLKNVDADAATAKAALISAGQGEVERMLSDAEERGARMKRDAERLVDQERKQLQQDLLIETVNAAVDQAHKLLERGATPEDHARLANELLAELQRKPAAARGSAIASRGAV